MSLTDDIAKCMGFAENWKISHHVWHIVDILFRLLRCVQYLVLVVLRLGWHEPNFRCYNTFIPEHAILLLM